MHREGRSGRQADLGPARVQEGTLSTAPRAAHPRHPGSSRQPRLSPAAPGRGMGARAEPWSEAPAGPAGEAGLGARGAWPGPGGGRCGLGTPEPAARNRPRRRRRPAAGREGK